MKVIRRSDFSKFRNNEHFQCQTEFKALVEKFDPMTLKIEALFNLHYLPLYADEDKALIKIAKNSFSEERSEADRQRDNIFRGLDDATKAALNYFDPVVRKAAKRIRIPFDAFGNIAKLSLNEETAAIYNLLQELRTNYADEVRTIGLSLWLDQLETDNKAYEALVSSGYEEEAGKTELKIKQTRIEIDKVLRSIFERIEALILINGETGYTEFIRLLNIQLEKYDNILAQRQGIAKARKEKEKEEKEEE
jgi:hypothetical protein